MIEEHYVSKWKDLFDIDIGDTNYFHRGQRDANWPLECSLKRRIQGTDNEDNPTNREFWCLREFKKHAPAYLDRLPYQEDQVAWLSLMQHHGIPTRLLDFTYSFFVATHFAFRDADCDCAVWSVDHHWLHKMAKEAFYLEVEGLRDKWDDSIYEGSNNFLKNQLTSDRKLENHCPLGIVCVEPVFLHKRLSAQRGLFLFSLNLEHDFLQNAKTYEDSIFPPIRKITFSRRLRDEAIGFLESMNIDESTLFPDIDGLARSLTDKILYK